MNSLTHLNIFKGLMYFRIPSPLKIATAEKILVVDAAPVAADTTGTYNILFLSETHSGKTALIEALKKYTDPEYVPKRNTYRIRHCLNDHNQQSYVDTPFLEHQATVMKESTTRASSVATLKTSKMNCIKDTGPLLCPASPSPSPRFFLQ